VPGAGIARTTLPASTSLANRPKPSREVIGDVGDQDGIAQVRLVGAVVQHRLAIGMRGKEPAGVTDLPSANSRRRRRGRLERCENIVLGDEAHFEVELVEFAWGPVRAGILVAKAGAIWK
jgi:hypothetical protein